MRNILLRFIAVFVFFPVLLGFSSCNNDPLPPTDAELNVAAAAATAITSSGAVLHGGYEAGYSGFVTDTGFEYRKSGEAVWHTVWLGAAATPFEYAASGLDGYSDYEYKALVRRSDNGIVAGAVRTFATEMPDAVDFGLATLPATTISDDGATINGEYDDAYSDYVTDAGFEYRKAGNTDWTRVWLGSSATPFEYALSGLEEDTEYEFHAIVKRADESIVVNNDTRPFTTLFSSPFVFDGLPAGTDITVTFTDGATAGIKSEGVLSPLPAKMIYSISSAAFSAGTLYIGRMSDETIKLSFDGGALQFRENGGRKLINTYAELAMINTDDATRGYDYLQESDIDMLGSEGLTDAGLTRMNWAPVGDFNNPFTGGYDGGGKDIANIFIDRGSTDHIGLFGSSSGALSNIHIISGSVTGKDRVGGVCGYSPGTITGCSNAGRVSGASQVGGVCGVNGTGGTVTACYNTGQVSGNSYAGGVSGANTGGTITACYNTGQVSGNIQVGGVCGQNASGIGFVTGCYNTGQVSGTNRIGGVCGHTSGYVTACYSTGQVSGTSQVGGVCGYAFYSPIVACYWLKYGTEADVGDIYGPYEREATPFGESAWPAVDMTGWALWTSGTPDPSSGPFWKSPGGWTAGGTPDGANSAFPKLYWEE